MVENQKQPYTYNGSPHFTKEFYLRKGTHASHSLGFSWAGGNSGSLGQSSAMGWSKQNAYLAPKGQRWINENDTYNCEVFGGQIEDRKISRCFKQSLGARVISIGSLQLRDMDTDMDRVTWTWTQTNMDRVTWTWTQETSDLHILYICGCFWAKFCVCLMFRTFRDVLFVGLTSRFPTSKRDTIKTTLRWSHKNVHPPQKRWVKRKRDYIMKRS